MEDLGANYADFHCSFPHSASSRQYRLKCMQKGFQVMVTQRTDYQTEIKGLEARASIDLW